MFTAIKGIVYQLLSLFSKLSKTTDTFIVAKGNSCINILQQFIKMYKWPLRVFNILNRHIQLCIDIQNKMLNSNLINFVRASHWTKRCVKEKSEREKSEFGVKTERVIRERGRVRISEQEETLLLQQNISHISFQLYTPTHPWSGKMLLAKEQSFDIKVAYLAAIYTEKLNFI